MDITHSKYFLTSLPFIFSSIAVSLMGSIDTAVVGRLQDYHYINAVALGAVIFSTIYWLFNFLGLLASGFASQSYGRSNHEDELYAFLRAGALALGIGLIIVIGKNQIWNLAMYLLQPPEQTLIYIQQYFDIIIYTVPFVLFYQTAQGWLAGMTQVKLSVSVGLSANIINMVLDIIFVYVFHWNIIGVAIATAIANTFAFLFSLYCFLRHCPYPLSKVDFQVLLHSPDFNKMLSCSSHLIIRTVCMLIMINTFMAQSSIFGGAILATNSILMQIQYVMGDVFAGFSQSAAVFAGIAAGRNDKSALAKILKISGLQCMLIAVLQMGFYYIFAQKILLLFTDLPEVLLTANDFNIYITIFPLLSALGIVYYGIFNGTLQTTPICISMLITLLCYLVAKFTLVPTWGNIGLWLAFLVFYFSRTFFLLLFIPKFLRSFSSFNTITKVNLSKT